MLILDLIDTGFSLIRDDPQHNLRVGFRCRLLAAFEEIDAPACKLKSKIRRVKLARLTVEKVLALWESVFPDDRTPHQALDMIDGMAVGAITSIEVEKTIGTLWTHCDDLMWKFEENPNPIMVGYGAIQAVREALSEIPFGCEHINDVKMDFDVDPFDHDSAFFASVSFSGGAPWEINSDSEKRFEFWTWWLTSAKDIAIEMV